MSPRDFYARMDEHIARTGRSVLSVGDDPPFTYTIGNHLRGLPEFVIFGLAPTDAGPVLNMVSELPDAALLGAGQGECSIGGRYPLRALPCPEWAKDAYSLQATRYLRTAAYRLVQLVVCDPQGRFPGDPGCAEPYRLVPILETMKAPGEPLN